MGKIGLLLAGHGSKKPYNKELITNIGDLICTNNPEFILKCGFMEFNDPDIPTSLENFKTEDIDTLVIVPLFLARGVHIDEDIPRILGLKNGNKTGIFNLNNRSIPLVYASPIGENPLLADLMINSAQEALKLIK